MAILKDERDPKKLIKELVISFKVIYINTYNVLVLDFTNEANEKVIFRHESF
jgi:hypothetical protein